MIVSRNAVLLLKAALVAALSLLIALSAQPAHADGPGGEDPPEDLVPPTVEAELPPGSTNGWFSSDTTITLRASDDHPYSSGIRVATYALSGATTGSGDIARPGTVITLGNEGITTVTLYAEDVNGNTRDAAIDIRVDKSRPEVTFSGALAQQAREFTVGEVVTAGFTCSDAVSYVDVCAGTLADGARLDTSTPGFRSFQVRSVDRAGNERVETRSYEVVHVLGVSEAPRISGEPAVGQTLTGTPATWSATPDTQTCRWVRGDGSWVQEAGTPLTLTEQMVDLQVRYQCSATKAGHRTAVAESSPVTVTALRRFPFHSFTFETGGGLQVGRPVTIVPPDLEGATFSYRWYAGDDLVEGATGRTLVPGPDLVNRSLRAVVTASGPGYEPKSVEQHVWGGIRPRPFTVTSRPTVSGTARVGQLLRGTPPAITADGTGPLAPYTVEWQWLRDGVAIVGATRSSYRLTTADLGRKVSVRMYLGGAGYVPTHRTSYAKSVTAAVPTVGVGSDSPRSRTVIFSIRVRATGIAATGKVAISRDGRTLTTVRLRDGRARVTLRNQKPGRARYYVRYSGAKGIAARKVSETVRVRR